MGFRFISSNWIDFYCGRGPAQNFSAVDLVPLVSSTGLSHSFTRSVVCILGSPGYETPMECTYGRDVISRQVDTNL